MTVTPTTPRRLSETELERHWIQNCPEYLGPGVEDESGRVRYNQPPHPRIGPVPHLLDPARRDAEEAERERRWLSMPPAERAALEHVHQMIRDQRAMGGGL